MMDVEKYRKQIGVNLKFARETQGWSVEQVAEMVGMKPATIGKMEAGEFDVKLSQVAKVCEVLGCKLTINW
jgi:transcriptional regulator with XRE-family HTH domain